MELEASGCEIGTSSTNDSDFKCRSIVYKSSLCLLLTISRPKTTLRSQYTVKT